MANPVAGGADLQIELIWLIPDWPDEAPVPPATAGLVIHAYALEGQRSDQPQLGAVRLTVQAGTSLGELIALPALAKIAQALASGKITLALHGRRGRLEQKLVDGDRLELLAGITADPRSDRLARVRKDRAAAGRDKWRTA